MRTDNIRIVQSTSPAKQRSKIPLVFNWQRRGGLARLRIPIKLLKCSRPTMLAYTAARRSPNSRSKLTSVTCLTSRRRNLPVVTHIVSLVPFNGQADAQQGPTKSERGMIISEIKRNPCCRTQEVSKFIRELFSFRI